MFRWLRPKATRSSPTIRAHCSSELGVRREAWRPRDKIEAKPITWSVFRLLSSRANRFTMRDKSALATPGPSSTTWRQTLSPTAVKRKADHCSRRRVTLRIFEKIDAGLGKQLAIAFERSDPARSTR